MFRSVLWLPSSSYDGDIYRSITIVSLTLPPKISINVGIQKWLFEGKKNPKAALCISPIRYLPITECARTKRDSEKSSRKKFLCKYKAKQRTG